MGIKRSCPARTRAFAAHVGSRPALPRLLPSIVAVAVLGALITAFASSAAALPVPVSDYADYPAALPTNCPDGPAALLGVRWSNERGAEADDLRTLEVRPGESVTTSWTAFDPSCLDASGAPAIMVSMTAYDAVAFPFDPSVDQRLLPGWSSCGAGATPCERLDDRYVLRLTLPTNDETCVVQFGTVLGAPLAVVGPSGSFYSRVLRADDRPNMLVGAQNYEVAPCVLGSTPTTATPIAPTPSPTPPVATTLPSAVLPSVVTTPPEALAFTGFDAATSAKLAALALALGVLGLILYRRRSLPLG